VVLKCGNAEMWALQWLVAVIVVYQCEAEFAGRWQYGLINLVRVQLVQLLLAVTKTWVTPAISSSNSPTATPASPYSSPSPYITYNHS